MNLFTGKMSDQLVAKYKQEVTEACNVATMDGYKWYDTTDAGLEPQLQLLRQLGVVAHHPVAHTLVRFEERR